MTKRVQLIRKDAVLTADFVGKQGELTVNLSNYSVHVHDGASKGGTELARSDLNNSPDATISNHGRMTAQHVLDIVNAKADIIQNAVDIAANLAAIQSNDTDIAQLNADLTAEINNRIAEDAAVTSAFQAADASLQSQISTNAANIASNDGDISNLQSGKADKATPATANSIAAW